MRPLKICLAFIGLLAAASPALAGNCSWTLSPSAVAFGTYSIFATSNYSSASQFTIHCTPNTTGTLRLSTGNGGSFSPRRMASGANTATYNLFRDPTGTQIWGDGSGGSTTYDVYNGTPQDKDFTDFIYGIVPYGQDLAVGTYTDTVFATLSYSTGVGNGSSSTLPPVAISVTMSVVAECRVDSFSLDFGTYNPFTSTAINQSTLLKVYCTRGGSPTSVTLNNGSFALGTQKRMMSAAGVFLNYTAALGSTSGTSTSTLVPINGGFALNGSVPAQQDVAVGLYQDTLVASVNY